MDEIVTEYFNKLKSPQKEICHELRDLILRIFPKIKEYMKYGVPYYDNEFYIVGLKDSVNLGFSIKNLTKEEISLFQGTGKTMRHLKFYCTEEIDQIKIKKLLELVYKK
ncbi:MAG: DUF1801 domain-containing protein [Candidatus Lokiarchaeota archaeon]